MSSSFPSNTVLEETERITVMFKNLVLDICEGREYAWEKMGIKYILKKNRAIKKQRRQEFTLSEAEEMALALAFTDDAKSGKPERVALEEDIYGPGPSEPTTTAATAEGGYPNASTPGTYTELTNVPSNLIQGGAIPEPEIPEATEAEKITVQPLHPDFYAQIILDSIVDGPANYHELTDNLSQEARNMFHVATMELIHKNMIIMDMGGYIRKND